MRFPTPHRYLLCSVRLPLAKKCILNGARPQPVPGEVIGGSAQPVTGTVVGGFAQPSAPIGYSEAPQQYVQSFGGPAQPIAPVGSGVQPQPVSQPYAQSFAQSQPYAQQQQYVQQQQPYVQQQQPYVQQQQYVQQQPYVQPQNYGVAQAQPQQPIVYQGSAPGQVQPALQGGAVMSGAPSGYVSTQPPPVVAQPTDGKATSNLLTTNSTRITCWSCNTEIDTNVKRDPGCAAYGACCCLCLTFPLCFWVPFCVNGCLDAKHSCPNCGVNLGTKPAFT